MTSATASTFRAGLLVCLLLGLPALATPLAGDVVGIATRLDGGAEVYQERHRIAAATHRIEYRAPDDTLIATKWLDYSRSDSAPAFEQHDLRSGRRLGAYWHGSEYVLTRDADEQAVAAGPMLVASSGFDRFVRTHWDALNAGERIAIDFAMPDRLQTVGLRIETHVAPAHVPGVSTWFRIEPASAVLRLFVAPIDLGYDTERRLRVYRGPSNLDAADGTTLAVDIRYRHEPPPRE